MKQKENCKQTYSSYTRTANIRVSARNKVHVDNEELGVHEGDIVNYTLQDILDKLDAWQEEKEFEYYVIEHNEDENNIHYHITLKFAYQCAWSTLKKKFPYGLIESCKHSVKACVRYMTHVDYEDKHQYSWDDIVTNAPHKLEKYKIAKGTSEKTELDNLLTCIYTGKIREFEIDKVNPDLYIKYRRKIENAFAYRQKILMQDSKRKIDVYVLQGPAGSGKTTYCKVWAEKRNKSYRLSSASNDAWESYQGEDVFIYEDFKPEQTNIMDFSKSISPHDNTLIASRYHNRLFIGDTIFICTNKDILHWYSQEPEYLRHAFFRRIKKVLIFEPLSKDKIAKYSVRKIINIEDVNRSFDPPYYPPHYPLDLIVTMDTAPRITFDLKDYIDFDEDEEDENFLSEDVFISSEEMLKYKH